MTTSQIFFEELLTAIEYEKNNRSTDSVNPMNHFSLTIASESDNIREIENFIEYIMDEFHIPEKLHARIRLPVIEAVTNSILFGNKNDSQKSIRLYAVKGSRKMVITVEEEGKGIDFSKLPDFIGMDELMEKTGRGLYLMIHLPDELIFANNGTKVIMTYDLNKTTHEKLCTTARYPLN